MPGVVPRALYEPSYSIPTTGISIPTDIIPVLIPTDIIPVHVEKEAEAHGIP